MKHTKTPWQAKPPAGARGWGIVPINAPIPWIACLDGLKGLTNNYDEEQAANAAFIVKAVNLHDQLVENLSAYAYSLLLNHSEDCEEGAEHCKCEHAMRYRDVQALLTRAKSEEQ